MPRANSFSGKESPSSGSRKAPSSTRQALRPPALSEPMYLILAVLADRPLHGYGILRELEERSGGEHQMLTGTLYNALRRLQSHGLVDTEQAGASTGNEPSQGAPRTKVYRITAAGLEGLRAEAQRMRALLRWSRAETMAPAMEEGR